MKTAAGFFRPTVIVSKCLCGARCRWDSETLSYRLVRELRRYARIIPVCPEVEIGLGVPRDRIILARQSGRTVLYQPSSGRQSARKMNSFAQKFLSSHTEIDGFILKHKSPSCGLRGVKLYESTKTEASFERRGQGIFAAAVVTQFPHAATEDEARLEDNRLREHWLTKLFALAHYRAVRKSHSPDHLRSFHAFYRTLLAAHHRRDSQILDRIVRSLDRNSTSKDSTAFCAIIEQYAAVLYHVFARPPQRRAAIKPCELALDHYAPFLRPSEKALFRQKLKAYCEGQIRLAGIRKTVQIWAVRYDKSFTHDHAAFRPYPQPLIDA